MKKTDWLADREAFRREWNTAAKWNLKHRPNDEETLEYYSDLKKPYAPPLHSEAESDNQQQQQPKKRIHIRHKHKRVCPEHALKEKERSIEHDPVTTSSPSTRGNVVTNDTLKANLETSVTNRMIRQQPVTYTLNQKADELIKLGLAKPPEMLLPGLHIPHVVGAGMCRMLTGGMPAHNARHYERRPNRDHPDFTKRTVDVTLPTQEDKKLLTKQGLLSTKRGQHSVNAQDVGGFATATKMPPRAMDEASEYIHKNHRGGVHHTDQPSADPLVLKQLHHSMTNRHRQWIPAVPKEVQVRAETGREELRRAVESEDGNLSSSSSSTNNNQQRTMLLNGTNNPLLSSTATRAHLPKSTLIPKVHNHHDLLVSSENNNNSTRELEKSASDRRRRAVDGVDDNQYVQPMLLRIPVSRDAFRKKDDIKTHHESKHSVGGKVMMRGVKA